MNLKRVISFFIVAAGAAVLWGGATPALADDCGLLGGAINGSGECEISSVVARTGTYNLDETLHVTGTGRIDASNASLAGITLNICVAPATPSANCDLILDTPSPLVTPPAIGGGQIEADDLVGNDNASPITIHVSRDPLMAQQRHPRTQHGIGRQGRQDHDHDGRNMTMNALATVSPPAPAAQATRPPAASTSRSATIRPRPGWASSRWTRPRRSSPTVPSHPRARSRSAPESRWTSTAWSSRAAG